MGEDRVNEVRGRYKVKHRKLKVIIKDMAARIGKLMSDNDLLIKEND